LSLNQILAEVSGDSVATSSSDLEGYSCILLASVTAENKPLKPKSRIDRLQLKNIEVEDNPVTTTQPRYSKEEFARRGDEIYQSQIRSQVEEGNDGKIVAIDIETAAFEVADNTIDATDRLYDRYPDAQPWVIRIGHRAVYRFGSRSLKKSV
jgi:hypothetical protein